MRRSHICGFSYLQIRFMEPSAQIGYMGPPSITPSGHSFTASAELRLPGNLTSGFTEKLEVIF